MQVFREDGLCDMVLWERVEIKPGQSRDDILHESKIVPGLFFNGVALWIVYENRIGRPCKRVYQLLRCLDWYGGRALEEDIVQECTGGIEKFSVTHAVSNANKLLHDVLGVRPLLSRGGGYVFWS